MPARFKPAEKQRSARTDDAVGVVTVYISIQGEAGKENITRSLKVDNSKVSTVAAYVEKALFGE